MTLLYQCFQDVRAAIRYAADASPKNGALPTRDPFEAIELFVLHADHAAKALLLIERSHGLPKAVPQRVRTAGTWFRRAWTRHEMIQLRNAIAHREDIIWNAADKRRGESNRYGAMLLDIPVVTFSDSFVGTPGEAPDYLQYLGVSYGLRDGDGLGVWPTLLDLNEELTLALGDPTTGLFSTVAERALRHES